MVEKTWESPQGKVFYLVDGCGPQLVFFHGAIATAHAYEPLLMLLARDYQVVAPIHPGHGQSFSLPAAWKLGDFTNFYRDFFTRLNISPKVLLGHSFGGTLALLLAANGVGKQVIVMDSPALPFSLAGADYLRAMLEEAKDVLRQRRDLARLSETALAAGTLLATVARHPEDIPLLFRGGPKLDISKDLARIKVPVEVFWGANDQIVPLAMGQKMHALLPRDHFTVLAGRGHNYPVTDPEFTYRQLLPSLPK